VPDAEVAEFRKEIEGGANPMPLKKRLGREIITQLYDSAAANEAEAAFVRVVQNKELPSHDIQEFKLEFRTSLGLNSVNLPQLMLDAGLVKSKREASRLIAQGGVELEGVKVTEPNCEVKSGAVLKVGKRRFIRLISS
jgi:tyrosyl-tRNA synthetase